jgi:hypothetical protein
MELIAHDSDHPSQLKSLIEQGHSFSLGAFEGIFLAHENFDLMGQEAADGNWTPSGQDLGLLYRLSVKTDGKVLSSVSLVDGHDRLRYT